jgi:hypothetical protein
MELQVTALTAGRIALWINAISDAAERKFIEIEQFAPPVIVARLTR